MPSDQPRDGTAALDAISYRRRVTPHFLEDDDKRQAMKVDHVAFGSIRVNGVTHTHDVVINHGKVRERKKEPSKRLREEYGHTPLSIGERIPWKCDRLVIGTGAYGALPVTDDVVEEAKRRRVELVLLPTAEAIDVLCADIERTNAILHVTC